MKAKLAGLLIALSFSIGLAAGWSVNGYRLTSVYDNYVAQQQAESAAIIKALREKEKEVRREVEEIKSIREEQAASMAAELDAANDSATGLRREIHRLQQRINANTSATSDGESSQSAAGMLAELSSWADALAGIYAEQADSLRLDLQMCQRVYNTVRDAPNNEEQD